MKKLNHYFQKVSFKSIVIILVATMLLTIPRMNVYSAIGDYQIASMAIKANNNFQLYKYDKEKPIAPAILPALIETLVGICMLATFAVTSGIAVGIYYAVHGDFGGQPLIYPDHINYSKYDFSQFDN